MEFATSIAENVLGRLASYASQEMSLAWGVQFELTKLNKTLSAIKLVLKDAEKKQVTNPLITHWLGNLKDVCHDIDDVLDELEFQKLRKKVLVNNRGSVKGQVRQFFSRWNPAVFNFKLGHKVKEIRERLVEIDNERREFALLEVAKIAEDHHVGQGKHDNNRETDSLVEALDVIGRDDDKKQIISHLLNNSDISSEENVSVISILGFGGLGKTTLAKLVYNMVEEKFEMKMWICVSENFDIRSLICGIINAAMKKKCEDEILDLMKRRLQDILRGRKFLLVLDDVWDTEWIGITIEKWSGLKNVLNVGAHGSKVIITTRNKSVALLVNPLYTHSLEGLSHKDSVSLFIKRAFNRGHSLEGLPQHLIKIGEDIVKKCGGVPLAVATVGSMLYLNTDEHQWSSVRDDDMWSIGNDNILPALKLSYDALPQHLKPCFAFCSLFPKDYQFYSPMLVPLWIAQGYLKTCKKNEDLDQMGIDYVRQFCSRSLFQVERDLKTMVVFKIHDLVRDLAISVAQIEYSTINFRPPSALEMVRHVSISKKDLLGEEAQIPDFMLKSKKLRTILIPEGCQMSQRYVKTCISRFKRMRVLDLHGSPLEELPSSIGSLFHLRFLNLSANTKIRRLPNSISKLLTLESLAFGGCDALEEIPKDIGNLINLRSLWITTQQTYLPKGIRRLTSLQFLWFDGCVNLKSLGEEIEFLNNLRKLWIGSCNNLESLPRNMKRITALDTLSIYDCEKLQMMMKSREGPQRLRSLCIKKSSLEALPPWLEDSADTLQSIVLAECHNLTALPELINFRFLEQLRIEECSKLWALPQGLHCLTELRGLNIEDCPELSKSCKRQLKGEEWSKMARQVKITLDSDVDTDDEEDEAEGQEGVRLQFLATRDGAVSHLNSSSPAGIGEGARLCT